MKHVFTTQIRYAIVVVVVVPCHACLPAYNPFTPAMPNSPATAPFPFPFPCLENCNCALLLARSDCVYETFRAVNFKRNAAINRTEIAKNPEADGARRRERVREREREEEEEGEGERHKTIDPRPTMQQVEYPLKVQCTEPALLVSYASAVSLFTASLSLSLLHSPSLSLPILNSLSLLHSSLLLFLRCSVNFRRVM